MIFKIQCSQGKVRLEFAKAQTCPSFHQHRYLKPDLFLTTLGRVYTYDQHFTQNSKERELALDKENIDFLFQTSHSKTCELVLLLSYNITVALKAFMDFFFHITTTTSSVLKMPLLLISENKQFLLWFGDLLSCLSFIKLPLPSSARVIWSQTSHFKGYYSHCICTFNLRVHPIRQPFSDPHFLLGCLWCSFFSILKINIDFIISLCRCKIYN